MGGRGGGRGKLGGQRVDGAVGGWVSMFWYRGGRDESFRGQYRQFRVLGEIQESKAHYRFWASAFSCHAHHQIPLMSVIISTICMLMVVLNGAMISRQSCTWCK